MRKFLLMSTSGCHLCDEAIDIIVATMDPQRHQVEEIDIAFEEPLLERYALLIPVLLDEQSGAELRWPFNRQQLEAFVLSL